MDPIDVYQANKELQDLMIKDCEERVFPFLLDVLGIEDCTIKLVKK